MAKLEYERKAKLTEEQLDNENAVLKVELLDKIAKIKKKNYDQSQTFGQKIYDMNIAFATAKEAKLLITANKKYNEAKQLADWILQNGELREEAKNFKIKAKNNRSSAEKYEPKIYANELFQKAERFYQTAEKFYNTIKFFEAKKNFDEAAKFFEQAKDKAFDNKLLFLTTEAQKAEKSAQWNELKLLARKIRSLNSSLSNQFEKKAIDELRTLAIQKELSSANKAKTAKNWRKVYYFAIATLKIDNSNIEAQNLKLEAENNLKPTLKIIAKVNGERVPARVKFGTQSMDTFYQTINDLKENSKYKGSLIWNTPNTVYVGNIEFICNWHGLKKITVSLKKQDFTTIDCRGVVLEMVKIKAGSFSMGNPESKWGRNNDEKLHRVTLTQDYWLGKFEVTQAQYESIMGNNPSHFQSKNRPVEQVCWDDAKEFCNKLNEYYADKLPIGYKFDLPTESQWEYACRAGTTTNFSYGDASDIKKMNFNGKYPYGGGLDGIFRRQTVNVGSLGYKNELGLYDMHGNVLEWCRDWYDSYTGDVTDPVGPSSGLGRVYRGGSWDHYAKSCRSANRDYEKPNYSNSNLGFRLALVPVK